MSGAERVRSFMAAAKRWSSLGIIAANAVPIVCILLFGWPAAVLLILYWCENVAIGAVTILKIAGSSMPLGRVGLFLSGFLIPFFTVHYGLFCFVHGIFVLVMTSIGGGVNRLAAFDPSPLGLYRFVEGLARTEPGFFWSLMAIVGWQFFSFVTDWLAKGRYRDTNPIAQMFEPYGRIIVMHFTLFVAAIPVMLIGNPLWAIIALAVMKTLFDLGRIGQVKLDGEQLEKSNEAVDELRRKLGGQTRR